MRNEEIEKSINGKRILVTGGTGSFGNTVVGKLLSLEPDQIIVFSRDEKKQFDMANKFSDKRIKYVLGDVRDKDRVSHIMKGVDLVFHAAALKQVPNCEFFPMEAVLTNVVGANNVINSAAFHGVERVVVLSTDKAVYPINAMGLTKALMERVMISEAREKYGKTIFCGTRYGNVMYTRGSVIPYFIALMEDSKPIQITDGTMTRFMMSLEESVDLVLFALANGTNGEIYVRKAPATTVNILAEAIVSLFDYKGGIEAVGIRPGEKKHETLVSAEEVSRATDCGEYYKIHPEFTAKENASPNVPSEFFQNGYTSANTRQLDVEETKNLILKLPELQEKLKSFRKK